MNENSKQKVVEGNGILWEPLCEVEVNSPPPPPPPELSELQLGYHIAHVGRTASPLVWNSLRWNLVLGYGDAIIPWWILHVTSYYHWELFLPFYHVVALVAIRLCHLPFVRRISNVAATDGSQRFPTLMAAFFHSCQFKILSKECKVR